MNSPNIENIEKIVVFMLKVFEIRKEFEKSLIA